MVNRARAKLVHAKRCRSAVRMPVYQILLLLKVLPPAFRPHHQQQRCPEVKKRDELDMLDAASDEWLKRHPLEPEEKLTL